MASPTRWAWVWVNSGSWWWTGRPGVLRFMGLQRVGHDWATELNWTELKIPWGDVLLCVLVAQSCLTLCNPTDYSLPGFSVHGILQARILEWIAIPFSRGTSQLRDRTLVSCITDRFFTIWATGKSQISASTQNINRGNIIKWWKEHKIVYCESTDIIVSMNQQGLSSFLNNVSFQNIVFHMDFLLYLL